MVEKPKKRSAKKSKEPIEFECPNCKAKLSRKSISVIMFSKATVISCPVCKKTISLQPKNF